MTNLKKMTAMTEMNYMNERVFDSVKVAQKRNYQWGVVDLEGNEIVPFGKYDWIDGFDHGLARVNKLCPDGKKWGIINMSGEEVLPVEYDSVWNFYGKNRNSTTVVKAGNKATVYFSSLNPDLYDDDADFDTDDDYRYGSHYGDFAGSYAQEEMGYSDDVIYDAFEGDPDMYWNID